MAPKGRRLTRSGAVPGRGGVRRKKVEDRPYGGLANTSTVLVYMYKDKAFSFLSKPLW